MDFQFSLDCDVIDLRDGNSDWSAFEVKQRIKIQNSPNPRHCPHWLLGVRHSIQTQQSARAQEQKIPVLSTFPSPLRLAPVNCMRYRNKKKQIMKKGVIMSIFFQKFLKNSKCKKGGSLVRYIMSEKFFS